MSETTHPPFAEPIDPGGRLRGIEWVSLSLLLLALGAWTWRMVPTWLSEPDLSHGLAAPLVFGILLLEARHRGTQRFLPANGFTTTAVVAAAVVSVLLLFMSGLYAAALDWSHSFVQSCLAVAFCGLLATAWLTASLRGCERVPFNWPAATAILIWALSAPIPPGTYTRLTQALQGMVTSGVLTALHLLGIAALKNGNVIELPHVSVGVEEACSGIRSLISCVFAAVFISAVMVRGLGRRLVILLSAAPLAVAMNFARSLLLTLLAERGIDISGGWHDATGFGVLFATAALLAALAWMLSKGRPTLPDRDRGTETSVRENAHNVRSAPPRLAPAALFTSLLLSCATVAFFVVQTRPNLQAESPPPDLARLLPASVPGWEVSTRDDLYRFSSQLQTEWLAERTYRREATQITVYLAYWPGGQAPVSLVASHTPDACWPGGGWTEAPGTYRQVALAAAGATLPRAEQRLFTLEGYPQHVWYWHLYDGSPIQHEGVESPAKLLSLAWHYGFRNDGAQTFIRISSNRSWEEIANEPLVRDVLQNLQSLGLTPRP